jgi:hypothetical protein
MVTMRPLGGTRRVKILPWYYTNRDLRSAKKSERRRAREAMKQVARPPIKETTS